jgi:hypothetical protein
MKYQVIVAGPQRTSRWTALERNLSSHVSHLGLQLGVDVEMVAPGGLNKRAVACAVWCGGRESDAGELAVVKGMADEGFPVFPVVDDLDQFAANTPAELHFLNGSEWSKIGALAADLMRALRLVPDERRAFISYKRSDSEAVAKQVFVGLALRGYHPFLDTASVPAGVDFQESLWFRMAGADLLVFIDTPHALDSRWVNDELARAHAHGLGVLQLVWPGHTRTTGTDFCDHVQLQLTDFTDGIASRDALLVDTKLTEILAAAEQSRVRSLALRRERVVGDILQQARGHGLRPEAKAMGEVRFFKNNNVVGHALPVVGLPDARTIHDHESQMDVAHHANARLVYSGLGASRAWLAHLEWLNERKGLHSVQVDGIGKWLQGL